MNTASVPPSGSVALEGIPLPAAVVAPYQPAVGDIVEVLRGRSFVIVLRKAGE